MDYMQGNVKRISIKYCDEYRFLGDYTIIYRDSIVKIASLKQKSSVLIDISYKKKKICRKLLTNQKTSDIINKLSEGQRVEMKKRVNEGIHRMFKINLKKSLDKSEQK